MDPFKYSLIDLSDILARFLVRLDFILPVSSPISHAVSKRKIFAALENILEALAPSTCATATPLPSRMHNI